MSRKRKRSARERDQYHQNGYRGSRKIVDFRREKVQTSLKPKNKATRKLLAQKTQGEQRKFRRRVRARLTALSNRDEKVDLTKEVSRRIDTSKLNKILDFLELQLKEVQCRKRPFNCLLSRRNSNQFIDEARPSVSEEFFSNSISDIACFQWLRTYTKKEISLHEEIDQFAAYVSLEKDELTLRHRLIAETLNALQNLWSGARLSLFGSFANNLAIYNSDVDLSIKLPSEGQYGRRRSRENILEATWDSPLSEFSDETHGIEEIETHKPQIHIESKDSGKGPNLPSRNSVSRTIVNKTLITLSRELAKSQKYSWVHRVEARLKCKVPVLLVQSWDGLEVKYCSNVDMFRFNLQIDLSVNGFGQDSRRSVQQMSTIKGLRPLSCILKVMLEQNGLDKPYHGGLGSFKLYALIAKHLLRLRQTKYSRDFDLGGALLSFLGFHSSSKRLHQGLRFEIFETIVDFSANFNLKAVVRLFRMAHERLLRFETRRPSKMSSRLVQIILHGRLEASREKYLKGAKLLLNSDKGQYEETLNRILRNIQTKYLGVLYPLDLVTIRELNSKLARRLEQKLLTISCFQNVDSISRLPAE